MSYSLEEFGVNLEELLRNSVAQELMALQDNSKTIFNIEFEKLDVYDSELSEFVLENPQDAVSIGTRILTEMAKRPVSFGVINLYQTDRIPIRMLRQEHIGKLIAVQGIVRRASEIRPRLVVGGFQCSHCGAVTKIVQNPEDDKISVPAECSADGIGCGLDGKYLRLCMEHSEYVDTQEVELSEAPEGMRGGSQPERIICYVEGALTSNDMRIAPGDRVTLNAVLKAKPAKRGSTTMYLRLDVVSVEFVQHEYEELEIAPEEVAAFEAESQKGRMLERIAACIAPSIHGLDTVKMAMALQQFGGQTLILDDGTSVRGDIHVLLVGDPGVAKTVLIRSIQEIAPRTVFAVGGASSRVGMTATAVRDEATGRWTLEAGALVLADKGVAIIDEIDKMTKEDMASMHEAMEQQTVTVTKAGINATLKSRCSVLGALNPKYGRFIPEEPLPQQIDLPPALLSRFDLVFTLRDVPNVERDQDIAGHIGKRRSGKLKKPEFESEFIKKYIAYARTQIEKIAYTGEAEYYITKYYVDMRKRSTGQSIAITARQIEGIYRLGEACARARLSKEMTIDDAKFAVRIVHEYLSKLAMDEGGSFDIDRATSTTSSKQRGVLEKVLKELRGAENGKTVAELVNTLQFKPEEIEETLEVLSRRTVVYCNQDIWRLVK